MNYRHAFHAGNHADVLKHLVLVLCLSAMRKKSSPFAVLDTHAGVGMYDLEAVEAQRSPEWRDGIGKLWGWEDAPPPVAAYLSLVRQFSGVGPLHYPGSPSVVAFLLRPQDLLIACELHPEDAEALRRNFGKSTRLAESKTVQIHQRDGWEALNALLPLPRPRGLVLIDPPYEEPAELERGARALGASLKRFGHGTYLWWRPLKSERALDAADAEAKAQGAQETLRADLWIDTPQPLGRLTGSSVLLINPPFGLREALREALPALASRLAVGNAGWRLQ